MTKSRRSTDETTAEDEKRICIASYFQIYFRAAVPEAMFSNAELEGLLSALSQSETLQAAETAFNTVLDSFPPGHPKRADFLWRLARASEGLDDTAAEHLAYAAAGRAADYRYDIMNVGEAAYAVNIVFVAARKLSASPAVQRVLEGAMARATDDTFATRLLDGTEKPSRNKILIDFSHVDVPQLKRAFMERMRKRYGEQGGVTLAQSDWFAFRLWASNSDEDRQMEQEFWRSFIGGSRKALAQAVNFIYPGNVYWNEQPTPAVDTMFPLTEFTRLLNELPDAEELDEIEAKALQRMQDLLAGKFSTSP